MFIKLENYRQAEVLERFESQGWKFAMVTLCDHGHPERVYFHPSHRGLLLRADCCGGFELLRGEIKTRVVTQTYCDEYDYYD